MKFWKWGIACCMLLSIVAWQAKDTTFQPVDTNGFIVAMQKNFAEVQAIKKKDNHREELERKMRDVHRSLTRTFPVYYDWWLQDGNDVNWFSETFAGQLSRRMQKLNIAATVTDTPQSIEAAFQSYLKEIGRAHV